MRSWRERWREAEAKRLTPIRFLATEYASEMTKLGYLPTSIEEMIEVKTYDNNIRLYYLAFFSKHKKGLRLLVPGAEVLDGTAPPAGLAARLVQRSLCSSHATLPWRGWSTAAALQRLDARNLTGRRGVRGLVEIPRQLEIQPELRLYPEETLQSQRCIRGHVPLAVHQLIHSRI